MVAATWWLRHGGWASQAEHDDGDREELEDYEVEAAITAYAAAAPVAAPVGEEPACWLHDGHDLIGRRVLRTFDADVPVLGTLTKWMAEDPATGDAAIFRAVHDDGDEEDLDQDEAEEGVRAFEASAQAKKDADAWKTSGHEHIGARVLRYFAEHKKKRRAAHGTVTQWLPAGEEEDEPMLFRVTHDDGDEEDLDEDELSEALEAAQAAQPMRATRRTARV